MSDKSLNVLDLGDWKTPATSYPDGTYGRVELRTCYWNPMVLYDTHGEAPNNFVGHLDYYRPLSPLPVKALYIEGKLWMVDDPSHWWAMQRFAKLYEGHVLVAGLGLGLIVHALQANPRVSKVTVVEKEIVIISLMKNLASYSNTTLIHQNWDEYVSKEEVNGVFYDLFVGDPQPLTPQAVKVMRQLRENYPHAAHHIHGFNTELLLSAIGDGPRRDGHALPKATLVHKS